MLVEYPVRCNCCLLCGFGNCLVCLHLGRRPDYSEVQVIVWLVALRARFYRRVAVHDPFVDNLQSISASASHQNSTAGDKFMSPLESPTQRWYRNH